jgi:hypothetical protein
MAQAIQKSTSLPMFRKRIAADYERRLQSATEDLRIHPLCDVQDAVQDAFAMQFVYSPTWLMQDERFYQSIRNEYPNAWDPLAKMMSSVAAMMLKWTRSAANNGAHSSIQNAGGWTLWISNHLRPLSGKTLDTANETLEERVRRAHARKTSRRNPYWLLTPEEIRVRMQQTDAENAQRANPRLLAFLLDMLPPSILDVLWSKSKTDAMKWLRLDLQESSTYIINRYMMRTYLAQTNFVRFVASHKDRYGGIPLKVIQTVLLPMIGERLSDLRLRHERVYSGDIVKMQLQKLAAIADSEPLYKIYDELTRIRESLVFERPTRGPVHVNDDDSGKDVAKVMDEEKDTLDASSSSSAAAAPASAASSVVATTPSIPSTKTTQKRKPTHDVSLSSSSSSSDSDASDSDVSVARPKARRKRAEKKPSHKKKRV